MFNRFVYWLLYRHDVERRLSELSTQIEEDRSDFFWIGGAITGMFKNAKNRVFKAA